MITSKAALLALPLFVLHLTAAAEDLKLCKEGWQATQGGKHERAISLYEECMKTGKLSRASHARTYRNVAATYRLMSKTDKAIEASGRALELEPEDPWADYVNRGNAFSDALRLKEAFADYARAEALKPDFAEIPYNRGIAYERQKAPEKAKAEFLRAYQMGLRHPHLDDRLLYYKVSKTTKP